MRGLTLIGAAAALVLGVTAAPQPQVSVDNNNVAPDAKTKVTTTTTVSKTKVITQTNIQVTTTTSTSLPQRMPRTVTASASGTTTGAPSGTSASTTATGMTTTELARQANPTAISTYGLADYAARIGKYFGTAVDYPGTGEGSDPVYLAVATDPHEFNQWTPANVMKYEFTEQSQGVFNFSQADQFVALAESHNITRIRCHNLIWHNELPAWINNGNWTNATLLPVMYNHIETLITHFGDKCLHWDVVNEALSDSPTATNPWAANVWYNAIGPYYVALAFQKAAQVVEANNLTVKLFYNDYNIEWPGAKTTNAAILVSNLTAAGIRIDGVGLQSHFEIGGTPSIATSLQVQQTYTNQNNSLGVPVICALTELDIRATALPVSDAQQIQQFNDYRTAVGGCAANSRCVGVTLWDFDDEYSWVPGTFPGQGYATPWFRANSTTLVKKIAYDGIIDGLTNTTALKK